MNELKRFEHEGFTARTIEDNGEIWIVAKDVAQSLGYSEASNPSRLFAIVPEIWAGVKRIHTRSESGVEQEREMLCLTEQGLYFFLGRSDKKAALPYQMWIAGDVVPAIRKTGSYTLHKDSLALPSGVLEGAAFILDKAGIKGNQLVLALDKLYRRHVGYSMLQETGTQLEAPTKDQLLTPTELGRLLDGKSARDINLLLSAMNYQVKVADKWEPLSLGMDYAIMIDTGKKHSDGTPVRQLKWRSNVIPQIRSFVSKNKRKLFRKVC